MIKSIKITYTSHNSECEFYIHYNSSQNICIVYDSIPGFVTVSFTNDEKENIEMNINKNMIFDIYIKYNK